ncbi:hypothetical protein DPQ33_11165 [Oceanidesulfovibrio indonesiensis]|uniref:DUF4325 domain-containing protein n=1 Tax=Oceanidesulfovibrio indonesiensis TaxID=54767 RepID=A0A7M3MD68_9BACT|nr:hypothetical protein DPQ33_11165 [Oceanidesulfovibrio indonesiensis]
MVINITNLTKNASTYEDGIVVFKVIKNHLDQGHTIRLSFSGIHNVPSSFVNSAVIQLLEHYSFDFIREHLFFINTTKQINDMIRRRFAFEISRDMSSKTRH